MFRRLRSQEPAVYATREDFCRIFQKDMNRLYRLSFLLTADRSMAEQCFVDGLHMSREGDPVFKEWAESWARRTIIVNAIRMIRPVPTDDRMSVAEGCTIGEQLTEPPEIAAIVELPVFERFAFVMSVLEGYSDNECSRHLSCTRGDVVAARTRAMRRLGRSVERPKPFIVGSGQETQRMESKTGLHLSLQQLAPSA
jgi:DNA-directed RNA polymerase specialized sigma24 family protein